MKLNDILSKEEIENYHQEWALFKQKYITHGKPAIETEYHTHSGTPVISKIFKYKDYPIFRTHVFQNRVKKIDSYFISSSYIYPFWHLTHYLITLEQTYHASMREIRNTNNFRAVDPLVEIKLSKPILWHDTPSVEMIWQLKKQREKNSIEDLYFSFYNDKNKEVKGRIYVRTFAEKRPHTTSIEKIKQGDKREIKNLIKMIEGRDISQKRLIKPRTNLPEKNYLISELISEKIPEEDLDNFFSFWDKP